MTKSAYGENPTEMKIDRLIKLYRENFIPKRNTIYSRGDFFWARQKAEETPEEHWKKLIEIEENCDFPNSGIKPADLLISKFITSITDEKLRDKLVKERNITIPQLNEFLKQDTYDKKFGKNLIPKQSTESQMKTEPIQKVTKTETKNRKCFLLRSNKLDTGTHMPGKKKLLQQMQKERTLCNSMQNKDKLHQHRLPENRERK